MESQHFGINRIKENQYPKLVRDNIPEIVKEKTGRAVKSKKLEDDLEFLEYLLKKIEEEASELANAEGKDHQIEEMADLLELLDVLANFNGIKWDEVRRIQKDKKERRGGFEKRILMLEKGE